jgi:hypothetical protein
MPARQKCVHMGVTAALGVLALLAIPRGSATVLESLQWKGAPEAKLFLHVVENRSGLR